MTKLIKTLEARLDAEEKRLKELQERFIIFTENEIDTSCFERNAMSELMVMLEHKATIANIKHDLLLLKR